jgi:schlafen family protein
MNGCLAEQADAARWSLVFEYELPLEGGRRPDVVVLAGQTIVVLEFKSADRPIQADLDQVAAYARDLTEYHALSHAKLVKPVLVLPRARGLETIRGDVHVIGADLLGRALLTLRGEGHIGLGAWLDAPYHPLPTLVAAARRIFQHEPLPHVRRAQAAGIPETVDFISQLIHRAADRHLRVLALVTGVPGAGKTLVGLRAVYERSAKEGLATFLSGNGPLVQVLQDALQSKVFVRDLHAFIKSYGIQSKAPSVSVIVFDEAQRAWDNAFMTEKRGVRASEPELLIKAGMKVPHWVVMVGLVGEGQEIYSGEEGGLDQWAGAIRIAGVDKWQVYAPPHIAHEFTGLNVATDERLHLRLSVRAQRAEEVHEWVRYLLEGSIPLAAQVATRVNRDDYPMYVTRDLDEAKEYARRRYISEPDSRYGLLASSHAAKSVARFGFDVGFQQTKRIKVARWFNAAQNDPDSCCALTQPITEFQCQGLELNLPIILWGDDFLWTGTRWVLKPKRSQFPQADPEGLLRNVYRVLLTRGRDGTVVVLPREAAFDATELAFLAAGLRPLSTESVALAAEAAPKYGNGNGG